MTILRKYKKWFILTGIVILLVLYFIFDPETTFFMPQCLTYALTGYECPGCGTQRMLHALLHGNFAAAWHYNPFILCAIPFVLVILFISKNHKKYPKLYSIISSVPVIFSILAATIAWGIIRNIH